MKQQIYGDGEQIHGVQGLEIGWGRWGGMHGDKGVAWSSFVTMEQLCILIMGVVTRSYICDRGI